MSFSRIFIVSKFLMVVHYGTFNPDEKPSQSQESSWQFLDEMSKPFVILTSVGSLRVIRQWAVHTMTADRQPIISKSPV